MSEPASTATDLTCYLPARFTARRPDWYCDALDSVRHNGFAIVEDVVSAPLLDLVREAMYEVQERIRADVGHHRLERAGELGVLRLMLRYNGLFYALLELEDVLAVVDGILSSTAILQAQNGLIEPPCVSVVDGPAAGRRFHRDFQPHLDGYVASISVVLAVDDLTVANGAELLVPGSHQREQQPDIAEMEARALPAVCPAGSMIVFDSTLWHAPGANRSRHDRLSVQQQFTRSFVRPQIDYVRALGDEMVVRREPRTQQLLGWYTRVVTSLDEYYGSPEERLYRR